MLAMSSINISQNFILILVSILKKPVSLTSHEGQFVWLQARSLILCIHQKHKNLNI